MCGFIRAWWQAKGGWGEALNPGNPTPHLRMPQGSCQPSSVKNVLFISLPRSLLCSSSLPPDSITAASISPERFPLPAFQGHWPQLTFKGNKQWFKKLQPSRLKNPAAMNNRAVQRRAPVGAQFHWPFLPHNSPHPSSTNHHFQARL